MLERAGQVSTSFNNSIFMYPMNLYSRDSNYNAIALLRCIVCTAGSLLSS
jgi:hypothetical protein